MTLPTLNHPIFTFWVFIRVLGAGEARVFKFSIHVSHIKY